MRLEIRYRTRYEYAPAAASGLTAIRLRPRSRPGLTVHSAVLNVETPGNAAGSYVDGWGTQVDLVEFAGPHRSADFAITAVVETEPAERQDTVGADEWYFYRTDSSRVRLDAVEALGWGFMPGGAPWTAVESVLAWMPQRFMYRIGDTDAETPIERFLDQGSGVCQDFAHVLLALLRRWGWCARYASGYVFTGAEGEKTIEAEAMHAWVEAYQPGVGWMGLDPTTGKLADDRYVPVAYGRDYDDVRPVRGIIVGESAQRHDSRLEIVWAGEQ